MPAAWNAATARSTASVAPPMTAWPVLLMFATTTYPSVFGDDALDLGERGKHGRHGAVVAPPPGSPSRGPGR